MGITNLSAALSCTISDTSIYVRLNPIDVTTQVKWEAGDSVQFQVGSITNPMSFGLTDSFKIYVTTSMTQDYFINQLEQGLSISNTQAGTLANVQLLPDSNQLSKTTNYAFYFTITSELPKDSYVEITFPQDYFNNLENVFCTPIKTASKNTECFVPNETKYDSTTGQTITTTNVIRIMKSFEVNDVPANTEIAFLLQDVTNPATSIEGDSISTAFSIKTLSSEGYPIDASDNLNFNIGCEFPCETCEGLQTACKTCLTLDDGT